MKYTWMLAHHYQVLPAYRLLKHVRQARRRIRQSYAIVMSWLEASYHSGLDVNARCLSTI